jgi:hypothetical protein
MCGPEQQKAQQGGEHQKPHACPDRCGSFAWRIVAAEVRRDSVARVGGDARSDEEILFNSKGRVFFGWTLLSRWIPLGLQPAT